MRIRESLSGKTLTRVLSAAVLMIVIYGPMPSAGAADTAGSELYGIVNDSLKAMWLGEDYGPELARKQQELKQLMTSGAVNKAGLEEMVGRSFGFLLDQHQTSRYNLHKLPERVEALFSPVLPWSDVKQILWRAASAPIKKENPVTIKTATLAPPGTPWINVPETLTIAEIDRLTGGAIQVKIYGGGVMGEDTDVLKKMDGGQLDGCGCSSLGVLAASPEASVLLLPGLFNNYEEVDYIFEKFRKRLDRAFEEKGYVLAALVDSGFHYLFSRNKITGLADLRKQKVVSWFGLLETTFYQELGITPSPLAVPEMVSALSTGSADVSLAPAAWVLGMQTYQYVNYVVKPQLLYSPGAILVSVHTKDKFRKQFGYSVNFSFNLQEMLVAEFNALEKEWKSQVRIYEAKSIQAFETKLGMKTVTLSPEDMLAIKKANTAVREKLAGKAFSKELMTEIVNALEAYRAKR
ncbi:MAG: TRAP transporter substrate-binding protein DctP [Thermodesulfobacteriota bacterium]